MSTVSPVAKVRDMLLERKPALADVFDKTFQSKAATDEREIIDLNKYFVYQLGRAPVSTLDERALLRDDAHPSVWLKYFESHVLPTLVRFNLPSE